jgi:hypothetical protein
VTNELQSRRLFCIFSSVKDYFVFFSPSSYCPFLLKISLPTPIFLFHLPKFNFAMNKNFITHFLKFSSSNSEKIQKIRSEISIQSKKWKLGGWKIDMGWEEKFFFLILSTVSWSILGCFFIVVGLLMEVWMIHNVKIADGQCWICEWQVKVGGCVDDQVKPNRRNWVKTHCWTKNTSKVGFAVFVLRNKYSTRIFAQLYKHSSFNFICKISSF